MLAILLATISALGFGSSAIFARVGMQGIRPIPSTLISAMASFVPSLLLAVVFAFSDIRTLPPMSFLWFFGHGALTFLGGRANTHLSINLIGASRAGPFISSSTLFTALFAITLGGERLHPLVAVGTAGVVAGLLLSGGDIWSKSWRGDRRSLLGYVLALGAAASYGASNLVAKELSEQFGSPLMVATMSLLFGMVVLAPLGGRGAWEGIRASQSALGFAAFGFTALSGLTAAGAVIALYFGFQLSDLVIVSPIASVNPLVTLLLAHFFLERLERVTRWLLLGTVCVVVGVILIIVGSTL